MTDHHFRGARRWSNEKLRLVGEVLGGDVVNVSAWRDSDKDGSTYRSYFPCASSYTITNWKSDARGLQGDIPGEIYLDLEDELNPTLKRRFDVVLNHTTLEHVFDIFTAFANLCEMSRGSVVVVVPFMQLQHSNYGDYWRFTPWAVERLFERNGMRLAYLDYNDGTRDSIYIVAAATRNQESFQLLRVISNNKLDLTHQEGLGRKRMNRGMMISRFFHRLARTFFHD